MKLAAIFAVVLISGTLAVAQKDPHMPAMPGVKQRHTDFAPPPPAATSAAELARIEQSSPKLRTVKPVVNRPPAVATAPAVDFGKNRPIRAGRSPQPTKANGH